MLNKMPLLEGDELMTTAENLRYFVSQMLGQIYIPQQLKSTTEQKVLHLSDTPSTLYPAIGKLVHNLQPDIIIHTGDLVDDIKLEHNGHELITYQREVGPLIKMLENSPARAIYIVPGNHDHLGVLSSNTTRARLLTEGDIVCINNRTFGLAHKMKHLPQRADFNLYGHNFKQPQHKTDLYLNGLQQINVILLPSNEIIKIPYTWATNRDRKMNDKFMLPYTM